VALQFGELLAHPPGEHALERVDQLGQGNLGREVHWQVDVVGLAVELDQLALEVLTHRAEDLFNRFRWASLKTGAGTW